MGATRAATATRGRRLAAAADPSSGAGDPSWSDDEHEDWREERRLDRRQRLLDAFVDLAGWVGCEGAGIARVCQMAGVSTRAFYATFESKEDCYVAALDARAAAVTERARQAYDAVDGPWEQRLTAGLESIMGSLAAHPAYARFCTVEAVRMVPAVLDRLGAAIAGCQRAFGSEDCAHLPPPLGGPPLDSMLVGALFQPMLAYVQDGRTDRLGELVPDFVAFLALAVLGRERAGLGRAASGSRGRRASGQRAHQARPPRPSQRSRTPSAPRG